MSEIVSRRSFLRGTAASMAALGALSLAGCAAPSEDQTPVADTGSWDKEADVVIVGYGFAGACAALAAQQGGSSVIVVEKAPKLAAIPPCRLAQSTPAFVSKMPIVRTISKRKLKELLARWTMTKFANSLSLSRKFLHG